MNRDETLALLQEHEPLLAQRFGVIELSLFGSMARDTANARSDIDVLVKFDAPATSKTYFGVQFYLEDLLNRPVDLVTDRELRPELRPQVESEAIPVSRGRRFLSEPGEPHRIWTFYVDDMITCATKVLSFTEGMTQSDFLSDVRTYDATLMNLALLGEAANRIPEEIRTRHPEIPWRSIIGTRNRLIHGYLQTNDDLLWGIIQDDVPALIPALRRLSQEHG